MDNLIKEKSNLMKVVFVFTIIMSLYFGMRFLSEMRAYGRSDNFNVNTITLSGHGEVTAVPDVANISFSISKVAKTAQEAQAEVAKIEKNALEFLRGKGVADKDIKT